MNLRTNYHKYVCKVRYNGGFDINNAHVFRFFHERCRFKSDIFGANSALKKSLSMETIPDNFFFPDFFFFSGSSFFFYFSGHFRMWKKSKKASEYFKNRVNVSAENCHIWFISLIAVNNCILYLSMVARHTSQMSMHIIAAILSILKSDQIIGKCPDAATIMLQPAVITLTLEVIW